MSPPSYWRLQSRGATWYIKQTAIRNGFTWEPMPPGVYVRQTTGERVQIMQSMITFEPGDEGVEAHIVAKRLPGTLGADKRYDIHVQGCWHAASEGAELAILSDFLGLGQKYLEFAKQMAAGTVPAPTPAPAPPPAEDGSGGFPS